MKKLMIICWKKNEELKKWNTIQLEAHEQWSYEEN
jgi:hypothetical protein